MFCLLYILHNHTPEPMCICFITCILFITSVQLYFDKFSGYLILFFYLLLIYLNLRMLLTTNYYCITSLSKFSFFKINLIIFILFNYPFHFIYIIYFICDSSRYTYKTYINTFITAITIHDTI